MMTIPSESELIYDWNKHGETEPEPFHPVELHDETLCDGLQNPSVTDPRVDKKIELLYIMTDLGIDSVDLGMPANGPRDWADITRMAEVIRDEHLAIKPNCAVRTVKNDITPLIEIVQKTGLPIDAATFVGSSPIRMFAEEWSLDHILKLTTDAVTYAVENELAVTYVTEDTTRARPEEIRRLYTAAIEAGANRLCVSDTCGYITPKGVERLIKFVKDIVSDTGADVKVDWHGHSDRGLAVVNAMTAIHAGADRIHATGLGIGERVGNTAMDLLLVNLKLDGLTNRDLTRLADYTKCVSEICHVPLHHMYPVFGPDAFRTATGVHAAAVIKAKKKGDAWLADRVYSGVPAGWFGLKQDIQIGSKSGVSNIVYWLAEHGVQADKTLVDQIFTAAKQHDHVMSEDEVWNIIKVHDYASHSMMTDTFDEWNKQIRSQGI